MLKVLIADDEITIRTGIKKILQSYHLDLEIVAEAADGELALELARKHQPDLLLVDINMPFLSGLRFLEKIRNDLPDALTIIITGYDEFKYAQKAIRLGVLDYLLKPINRQKLFECVSYAIDIYNIQSEENVNKKLANQRFEIYKPYAQEDFLKSCIENKLEKSLITKKLNLLKIKIETPMSLFIINDKLHILKNFLDLVNGYSFYNDKYLVLLIESNNKSIHDTKKLLYKEWIKHTSNEFICLSNILENGILNLYDTYKNLIELHGEEKQLVKNIEWITNYIENHYANPTLTLQELADKCYVSPSYLTRIMRQKLGLSFIEYVTEVRLKRATQLLITDDDEIYIYQIAKSVGYNSQHYFSRIFKNKIGMSPKEYRENFH